MGTVVPPDNRLSIDPAVWDFGTVPVGESASHTFVLHNDTDVDSEGIGGELSDTTNFYYDFSGPFSCLTPPLPAGGSCTVTVTFMPGAAGSDYSTLMTLFTDLGYEEALITGNSYAPSPAPSAAAPTWPVASADPSSAACA